MELYGIDSQELPKNVGNKGTCPFTFKGQWIRKALISRFGRMFDQYVFSIRPLLDNTSAISPVSQLFCLLSKNAHNAPKILHKLGLQFVCNDCNTREKLGKNGYKK